MRHARGAHRCGGAEGEKEGGLNSLDGRGEVTVPTPSDLVAVAVSVSPVIREKEAGRKKQRSKERTDGKAEGRIREEGISLKQQAPPGKEGGEEYTGGAEERLRERAIIR